MKYYACIAVFSVLGGCGDDTSIESDAGAVVDAARIDRGTNLDGGGDLRVDADRPVEMGAPDVGSAGDAAQADGGGSDGAMGAGPMRVVFVFGAFGSDVRSWPEEGELSFEGAYSPLAPWQSTALAVRADRVPGNEGRSNSHFVGVAAMWTGAVGDMGPAGSYLGGAPSADQQLAEARGEDVLRFAHVSSPFSNPSWLDDGIAAAAWTTPLEALEALTIRTSEADFAALAPDVAAFGSDTAAARTPERSALYIRLLVRSFEVGAATTAVLNLSTGSAPWLGIGESLHLVSHDAFDERNAGSWTEYVRWQSAQVASLLAELEAVDTGRGTLMDETLVVWTSEVFTPWTHDESIPFLVFGGAGDRRTGQSLDLEASQMDVLQTLLNAADSDFGGLAGAETTPEIVDELLR